MCIYKFCDYNINTIRYIENSFCIFTTYAALQIYPDILGLI